MEFASKLNKMVKTLKESDKLDSADFKRIANVESGDAIECLKFYNSQLKLFKEIEELPTDTYEQIFEAHR